MCLRSFIVSTAFVVFTFSPAWADGPSKVESTGKTADAAKDTRAKTIAEAWSKLSEVSGHGCGNDLGHDYGSGGGMRNFFCRSLTVFSWRRFIELAPVNPFKSGPHEKGRLNLQSAKSFGHYDPAFVRWATKALVPASEDSALRVATQGIYNREVRELARVYFKVWQAINHDPKWREEEAKAYVKSLETSYDDHINHIDYYHDILGLGSDNWGGNNPNTVRSAAMWWVRRSVDGTADLWAEGLVRLLTAYDGQWLKGKQASPTKPAPEREPGPTPEYR